MIALPPRKDNDVYAALFTDAFPTREALLGWLTPRSGPCRTPDDKLDRASQSSDSDFWVRVKQERYGGMRHLIDRELNCRERRPYRLRYLRVIDSRHR